MTLINAFLFDLACIIGAIFCFVLFVLVTVRIVRKLVRFPAPPFIGRFLDSSFRRFMQRPDTLIARSGFEQGMNVLEAGCGSGSYTTFVARKIGPEGTVYALDVQQKMLDQLTKKLELPAHKDLKNILPVLASIYTIPFDDNMFDLVYMVTVLQEIPDRHRALSEINRVLKPGGILAVTEFLPDPDYPFKKTVVRQLERAGFGIAAIKGAFWTYTVRAMKT
jgi:ubiquinone/menaquinone biosynthesis C-methylase UbiE